MGENISAGQTKKGGSLLPSEVAELLKSTISSFDNEVAQGMIGLFPGGPEAIERMSNDEIRAITTVNGQPHPNIIPCLAGTTVLVALLDPARQLYVASLGDSHAGGSVVRRHSATPKRLPQSLERKTKVENGRQLS